MRDIGDRLDRGHAATGMRLTGLVVSAAIASIFCYQLAFNFLPDSIRLPLAGVIALGLVLACTASLFVRPFLWRIALFGAVLTIGVCWIVSEAVGAGRLDATVALRFLFPLFFGIWIVEYRADISPRLVFWLVAASLLFGLFWTAVHPQQLVNKLWRFPPFTGGEDGAHSSAYVVAVSAVLVHQLMLSGHVSRSVGWTLIGIAAFLLIGLRVATPAVMLLNYALLRAVVTRRLSLLKKIGIWLVVFCSLLTVIAWHELEIQEVQLRQVGQVESIGSGRVGTWISRIDLLSRRDAPTLLFGSGPGSDSFYSPNWWWTKKDSHSDLLTVLIEAGFVGLSAILLFYYGLYRRLGADMLPFLAFTFSGSLISNSLMQRPMMSAMLMVAVALAASRAGRRLPGAAPRHADGRPAQPSLRGAAALRPTARYRPLGVRGPVRR